MLTVGLVYPCGGQPPIYYCLMLVSKTSLRPATAMLNPGLLCLAAAVDLGAMPRSVSAQELPRIGDLEVVQQERLRFGSMVVPAQGRRTVTATGSVIDEDVLPSVWPDQAGPGRFTVTYDRGNNGRQALDIEVLVMLPVALDYGTVGLRARLTNIVSDVQPATGQTATIRLRNCVTRVCAATFRIGGTLSISRNQGGGSIVLDVPLQASVIRVARSAQ